METRAQDRTEIADAGDRTIQVTASDETVDRFDSIVRQNWKLDNFKKNPVIQFAHSYNEVPVGKATAVWIEKRPTPRLRMKVKFAETDMGRELFSLYRGGYMRAFSIGFMPLESRDMTSAEIKRATAAGHIFNPRLFKPLVHEVSELYELSAVPVPGNPNALVDVKLGARNQFQVLTQLADTCTSIAPQFSMQLRSYLGESAKVSEYIRELSRVDRRAQKNIGRAAIAQDVLAELDRKTKEIIRKLTVPAAPRCTENQLALIDAQLETITRKLGLPRNTSGFVPMNPENYRKAPRGEEWRVPGLHDFGQGRSWGQLSLGVKISVVRCYAWSPLGSVPHRFCDLRLPHHRASDGAVVFAGVLEAVKQLGETKLPAEDRKKVKAHLARHLMFDFQVLPSDVPKEVCR